MQLVYDHSHNVTALSYKYDYEITIMCCFAAALFSHHHSLLRVTWWDIRPSQMK